MTSIPVAICSFSDNNVKPFYLKKKRHFVNFLLHFQNVDEIENILKKKEYSILIITEIIAPDRDVYLNV